MRTLADGGLGILLVEQFAALALQVGDQVHVLSQGRFAYSGPCQVLKDSPDILKRAYLGES
jgi:branched-chain amino acid transport system ATP-binding protein